MQWLNRIAFVSDTKIANPSGAGNRKKYVSVGRDLPIIGDIVWKCGFPSVNQP